MSTRKLRRPAALVASLALVFAVSACADDDPDPNDPADPVTTTVPLGTTAPLETTTTPAG
ncbi:MAG TPA: hypothetical protein VGC03_15945 [Acidimicrobiia bacterium]|jgi:uncharacterized protein YcgI (DUF1989 family)